MEATINNSKLGVLKAQQINGQFVHASSKPHISWMRFVQEVVTISEQGFDRLEKRSILIKGDTERMKTRPHTIEGNLVVIECLASDIHPSVRAAFNKNLTLDENIEKFAKRRMANGTPFKVGNDVILRHTIFDASGTKHDIRLQATNGAEIQAEIDAKGATTSNAKPGKAEL